MEMIYKLDDLSTVAAAIIEATKGKTHFAFYGSMGAGKTTLTKAICRCLGVTEEVNSPTFSIINEYDGADDLIYHFDFYRINSPQEAVDFGVYDYFDSGRICLMEWPECIESLLPDDVVRLDIEIVDDSTRKITIND
ncbi:MAG: tRNA (adenosine(37)-N6)-threonylcarbamoyltransferase complex ATPase subunit type 1 TsaE [bacterium]